MVGEWLEDRMVWYTDVVTMGRIDAPRIPAEVRSAICIATRSIVVPFAWSVEKAKF